MIESSFFYVDSWSFRPGYRFFCGYALFDRGVVLGGDGFAEYFERFGMDPSPPTIGRFVGCFPFMNKTCIKTDDMGQELLFLYQSSGGAWAVSNSFWLLLHKLRLRGLSIEVDGIAHCAFALKDGKHIGEQLLSEKTPINSVHLVPSTKTVFIDHYEFKLKVEGLSLNDYVTNASLNGDDLLIDHLEEQLGVLSALRDAGHKCTVDLSGGYDSRLCFGLARKVFDDIQVKSWVDREEDYVLARKVASHYKVPVNENSYTDQREATLSPLSAAAAVDFWELSSGGVYLPIYPVHKAADGYKKQVSLGGDVSYGFSFFAGRAIFNGSVDKVKNDIVKSFADRRIGSKVSERFLEGVTSTGAPVDSKAVMQLYYSSFRSRFHAGRNSYKVPNGRVRITPLSSSKLLALSVNYLKLGYSESHLISNLYAAIDPELASFPFAGKAKNIDYGALSKSPLAFVELRPRAYTLYDGSSFASSGLSGISELYSYHVDGGSIQSSELAFKEEINSRMAGLYRALGDIELEGVYETCPQPVTPSDKLSVNARFWAKQYFFYKLYYYSRKF